jgi:hypothetical protein
MTQLTIEMADEILQENVSSIYKATKDGVDFYECSDEGMIHGILVEVDNEFVDINETDLIPKGAAGIWFIHDLYFKTYL